MSVSILYTKVKCADMLTVVYALFKLHVNVSVEGRSPGLILIEVCIYILVIQ